MPHTNRIPKPLFPINGVPLIDRLIKQLQRSGCTAISVNTHHLHSEIEAFLSQQAYTVPLTIHREAQILGTGGAIKNLSDFWGAAPFLVVNADIYTDIDFMKVYAFHCCHKAPATLVLTDDDRFNSVSIDETDHITSFQNNGFADRPPLTFSGIQVIDPAVLELIPDNQFSSSIDAYQKLIDRGTPPKAYLARDSVWKDIGTPDRYVETIMTAITPKAFQLAFGTLPGTNIGQQHLAGDGSDRKWYRLVADDQSLIIADHGIHLPTKQREVDAFIRIGRHLNTKGISVPRIFASEPFAGLVYLEDMGNLHLQGIFQNNPSASKVLSVYEPVIDLLIQFSQIGIEGFDLAWTYQTASYDHNVIIEKECHYFRDAFLKGYLDHPVQSDAFHTEFERLAKDALTGAVEGLMHRDFQSRNILIYRGKPVVIDFQGARKGPIQYDLASLLIDPYSNLSPDIQEALLEYCLSRISTIMQIPTSAFINCFRYCCITRNLQILGAFGYLTRIKGKTQFERYIPTALQSLEKNLRSLKKAAFPALWACVEKLCR